MKQASHLYNFLEETSIHGGKHISNSSRSLKRRMIWGIFLLTSLGGLSYFIINLLIQHYNYSVQTVYKFYYKDAIEFPTVTLCSACPFVLLNNHTDVRIRAMMNTMSTWESTASSYKINETLDLNIINDAMDTLAINMSSLFLQIKWNGKVMKSEDVLIESVTSTQKKCFVFNGKMYQAENGSYISDKSGMNAGLEMIVDVKQSYCPGGILDTAGLEVYLHSAIDDEPPDTPKAVISPGNAAFVGLRKLTTLFLPYPYKAIGNKYCTEKQNYSKNNCISQCVVAEIRKLCPCMPALTEEEKGSVELKKATETCTTQQILFSAECLETERVRTYQKAENTDLCDCPDPCILVDYETDVSYGYFPTQADSEKLVKNGVVPDVKYARENILKFTMNYNKKLENTVEYVPEHNPETFLGTIGGHLGLFIGASILSILEFVELIVVSSWMAIANIFTSKKTSRTTVKPFKN